MQRVAEACRHEIVVPASIANLGPGLDTLGLAVALYLRVRSRGSSTTGPGGSIADFCDGPLGGPNRIEQAFRRVSVAAGAACRRSSSRSAATIPLRGGLGSSAAATIAGMRLRELVEGRRDGDEILGAASKIEGHPDNAAAALFGGVTSCCERADGSVAVIAMAVADALAHRRGHAGRRAGDVGVAPGAAEEAAAGATRYSTCSTSRCCLSALQTGQGRRHAARRSQDRAHQPYREALVPGLRRLLALRHPDVIGVCLSGAGPTVAVFASGNAPKVESMLRDAYAKERVACTVRTVKVHREGDRMTFMTGLQCHLCGAKYPAEALWVCEQCLGPLEVVYDYDGVREAMTRDVIERRAAQRLALPRAAADHRRAAHRLPLRAIRRSSGPIASREELGLRELYIKDDSVNHPTLSYKDRVVSMAATRAVELGFTVFGCASTGNLANSVSAHAARLGLECYVFIPHDLELGKVLGSAVFRPHVIGVRGNYDDVNRLCTQIADKLRLGIREHQPAQLLRRRRQDARVRGRRAARLAIPEASRVAGRRRHAAAAHLRADSASCARSVSSRASCRGSTRRRRQGARRSIRALEEGLEFPEPVKPNTIAKSIAIGNPADGFQVVETVKETGGIGRRVDRRGDPAGDGAAGRDRRHLHRAGRRHDAGGRDASSCAGRDPGDESVVVCITGNGYKTAAETIGSRVPARIEIGRELADFEAYLRVVAGAGGRAAQCR